MAIDIKQAHRRLMEEAWGKGNFDVFDEVCDAGYRGHDPLEGESDLRKTVELCRSYRAAFPDMKVTLLGSYADGDTVVTHWRMTATHKKPFMGIEPKGVRGTVEGVSIGKFRGGKLAEEWVQWDALGLLRQLGVAPKLETGAPTRETRPHA